MDYIFLTCIHDRHTDDKFLGFLNKVDAKDYLRKMILRYRWFDAVENLAYGDWCLFISDDYYMSVEKIKVESGKVDTESK